MDKKEEGLSFKEIFKQNKNEYFRLKHSIYRKNNKEHYRSTQKEWQKNNKKHYDCLHKSAQKAYNIRNKNNKKFIINNVCRKALNLKLREKRTWGKVFDNRFGYTHEEFAKHMINQFDEKMSIGNYGKYWEVDHIKPVSQFDYISYDDKEFKECWSLKNLRPLEKSLNRKKINTKKI